MAREEFLVRGLELCEFRELKELAIQTLGEPMSTETAPIDGLGELDIWQREVKSPDGEGEPLTECFFLSRLALEAHGNQIDSESPLGQLLERLQEAHPGQE